MSDQELRAGLRLLKQLSLSEILDAVFDGASNQTLREAARILSLKIKSHQRHQIDRAFSLSESELMRFRVMEINARGQEVELLKLNRVKKHGELILFNLAKQSPNHVALYSDLGHCFGRFRPFFRPTEIGLRREYGTL